MLKDEIAAEFNRIFGAPPQVTERSPGRVNLIGEHTDYNGGMVLPTALPIGLKAAVSPRKDQKIRIASTKFDTVVETNLTASRPDNWAGHAIGAVLFAKQEGLLSSGADIAIDSTVPDGAGLSSSAALIVTILKAARRINHAAISDEEIAILARRVENEFIGVPCGIMDQMAVSLAHPGQALALDTKSLAYTLIDLPRDYHMAVVHSGCQRKLSEGRYKERKEECDAAGAALGVEDLCLLTDEQLAQTKELPGTIGKRARHCATEHRRTRAAATAMENNAIDDLGRLMNESHVSMRDDFEMSLPAIDALVADAQSFGAVGARLTGGGFGGCIVACVASTELAPWKEKLCAAHPNAYFVC